MEPVAQRIQIVVSGVACAVSDIDLLGFFEPFIPIKRLRLGWVDAAA
jgi:hypothetical protein